MTPKQERFVQEYCANGGNGVEAARAAGYGGDYNALGVMAHENLRKPKIQSAIETFKAKTAERCAVTVESLTKQLQEIADNAKDTQPGAAVSALNPVAKMHGLLAEDRKNALDPLTDAMATVAKAEREKRALH